MYIDMYNTIKQAQRELFGENDVLIIIEELDICNTYYALEMAEIIQHLSSMKVVIVSYDLVATKEMLVQKYGSKHNNYFDKILMKL